MTTTIQVSKATKQLLDILKKKEQATSYDLVIQKLAKARTGISKSMFGAAKGLKWKREDRLDFDES